MDPLKNCLLVSETIINNRKEVAQNLVCVWIRRVRLEEDLGHF